MRVPQNVVRPIASRPGDQKLLKRLFSPYPSAQYVKRLYEPKNTHVASSDRIAEKTWKGLIQSGASDVMIRTSKYQTPPMKIGRMQRSAIGECRRNRCKTMPMTPKTTTSTAGGQGLEMTSSTDHLRGGSGRPYPRIGAPWCGVFSSDGASSFGASTF